MLAATPRLRDRLDVRTLVLVAIIALAAFGLQIAFLAGMVASPLGGAIADLDRIPQAQGAPIEAIADANGRKAPPDVSGAGRVSSRPSAAVDAQRRTTRSPSRPASAAALLPPGCPVDDSHAG